MLFQCILCVGFFGSIAVCDSCGGVTEGPNTTTITATTEKEEQEQEHHQKPSLTTRTTTQQMQGSQKKKEELHHVHGLGLTQCLVIANKSVPALRAARIEQPAVAEMPTHSFVQPATRLKL